MSAPSRSGIVRSPVALAVALVVSVSFFVLVLSVVSFVLRDAPLGAPRPQTTAVIQKPVTSSGAAADVATQRPPPGSAERQSASTAVAPVFPGCVREARARDPSLANEVELIVGLDTKPGSGTITSLRMGRGSSPFLAACLRQHLVGAGFPAGADGQGVVRWRATVEGERAVLVEIESD